MPLILRNALRRRFRELVEQAEKVDVAVAWAKSCDAVDALVEGAEAGKKIRAAVGLSFNGTDPTTLRRLQRAVNLRIASPARGIFHPKYFCFRIGPRRICWVGSANLTGGGFGGNVEMVSEFDDETKEGQRWFTELWRGLNPNPEAVITQYEQEYERSYVEPGHVQTPPYRGDAPEIPPLAAGATWNEFVDGLHARNRLCHDLIDWDDAWEENWDVLSERRSYLHTIVTGRKVVRLPEERWQNLTERECFILRGEWTEEGEWGLVGSLGAAGRVRRVFNPEHMPDVGPIRTQIRAQIDHVLATNVDDDALPENASAAVQALMEIHGVGPSSATRLLTLARPNLFVSVNGESAVGLATLSGHPHPEDVTRNSETLKTWVRDHYADLLRWVYEQPWFNAPEPDEPLERRMWNCRAALLDAFVYARINPQD